MSCGHVYQELSANSVVEQMIRVVHGNTSRKQTNKQLTDNDNVSVLFEKERLKKCMTCSQNYFERRLNSWDKFIF